MGLAQFVQSLSAFGVDDEGVGRTPAGLNRRSWVIRWKAQGFGICKLILPVSEAAVEQVTLQALALPGGKIGVLERQIG